MPISYFQQISASASRSSGIDEMSNPPEVKSLKFIRLLRLGKLLRLVRMKTVIKRHEEKLDGVIGYESHSMCF